MVVIGEAVIDDAIPTTSFCCDLDACKGACCCIEGGRGAPLEDGEVLEIEKAYPAARQYLDERSIRQIERDGFVNGSPGDFATNCIDDRECVFVFFDQGVASCAFERAFRDGKTSWPKPLSCHLFPLRARAGGRLEYEKISECYAARKRGEALSVPLGKFLRDPLIRKFGEEWYQRFLAHCEQSNQC